MTDDIMAWFFLYHQIGRFVFMFQHAEAALIEIFMLYIGKQIRLQSNALLCNQGYHFGIAYRCRF